MPARSQRPQPAVFEEVSVERFLAANASQVTRGATFVAWCDPTTAGIFATGPQTIEDLRITQGFCRRQLFEGPPRALLLDAREFGVDALSLDNVLEASPLLGVRDTSNLVRISVVLPLGWSRAWWLGAIALGVGGASTPARGFTDPDAAWHWLGASDETRHAVEQLRVDTSPLRSDLQAKLRVNPTLSISEAARTLRSSPRSLQRALKEAGISFAEVRSRARAELATALLRDTEEKVDVVATRAGFRSRSHFASWFQRVTGQSPLQFRRHEKASKP